LDFRHADGSAGDADYGLIGEGYARYRRPDPRIAATIAEALGDAGTVLNVGAGAGSYEPLDRRVTAIEPSASMRAQRPAYLPAALNAVAEALPFDDASFDASMASFTVHQWSNLAAGLAEMRRVTRGNIAILTCDPDQLGSFWLDAYAPEIIAVEAQRYPKIETILDALGAGTEVIPIPIPFDCTDGFGEAYFGRPERLLDPQARLACSAWSFVDASVETRFATELGRDLESGRWDSAHGYLRIQSEFAGSLRLVVRRCYR
jgi:hypothetical protein